uniref:MT-A70 family protein n=1 Tax=Cereibacter sphaeroides (strain ATCC 17025 / ATH 2.4.3) TaxID=349102 RepID=A4WS25_CERS5
MSWPFQALTPMKYGAILADPPWQYRMWSEAGHAKSPEAHYATAGEDWIASLPVSHLAGPDCLLFLWTTWPHLPQAMRVMKAWGFRYVTGGSWNKRTAGGKTAFGTGYILRSASEPYLVGKIGAPQIASRSCRNLIDAEEIPDTIEAIRREHSRKPIQMRQMIETLLPRAYACELFAREPWPGQDVWGNETERFAAGEAPAA